MRQPMSSLNSWKSCSILNSDWLKMCFRDWQTYTWRLGKDTRRQFHWLKDLVVVAFLVRQGRTLGKTPSCLWYFFRTRANFLSVSRWLCPCFPWIFSSQSHLAHLQSNLGSIFQSLTAVIGRRRRSLFTSSELWSFLCRGGLFWRYSLRWIGSKFGEKHQLIRRCLCWSSHR